MRRLPPLSSLPAFEAVARLGSVKAAGEELGRTHGAVSKQIATLAEDLGVALFRKEGVGIRLTREGEEFAQSVSGALDRLAQARDRIRLKGQEQVIEIGLSATLAMRWLIPRMPSLYLEVPGMELSFRMTGSQIIPDHEIDVALTFDRLSWIEGYYTRSDIVRLGDVAFGPVHAPGFELVQDGVGYHCAKRYLQQVAPGTWDAWSALTGVQVSADQEQTYPHTFLALEGAVAGLGAAMSERRLVAEELATGGLVAPFGFHTVDKGFGAIVTERGRGKAKVQVLLDWLGRQAASD
ncbi:LysR family transcriptional regulator [Roseibium sp. CAU 1637]|uniref:LysR family transcriptional regulator n=1 Tax=Roseibium limicola TaxID=2816037 RepID=A0A939J7W7_9HYPH|nr:LysR family transcriptional regulator [Roseibium limicola]MBO0343733.1 LysR family transcriptional regulator [Roseibium limicola]